MRRWVVLILGLGKIEEACQKHPDWQASLAAWRTIVSEAAWRHFPDVRQTFNMTDKVCECYVFNVRHNRCRVIARINFREKWVVILHVLDHVAYDKDGWKDDCDCD
jgi:mRNA interferase HigB